MTRCLAPDCQMGGIGGDNMTVVLICLLHNKPYENLVERCSIASTRIVPDLDAMLEQIQTQRALEEDEIEDETENEMEDLK